MNNLKTKLGRATWNFLHTFAWALPRGKLNPESIEKLHLFVELLADLYPCEECAKGFRHFVSKHMGSFTTREEVIGYFCRLHNLVNMKLGKPNFDCKKLLNK